MIKAIALTFAAFMALAPINARATETAVMGGGTAVPPAGSPGPNAGVTTLPDRGAVRAPAPEVGQIPHPAQAPPSNTPNDCAKTACANPNGGGEGK